MAGPALYPRYAEAPDHSEKLLAQFEILYPTESLLRTAIRAVAACQLGGLACLKSRRAEL